MMLSHIHNQIKELHNPPYPKKKGNDQFVHFKTIKKTKDFRDKTS